MSTAAAAPAAERTADDAVVDRGDTPVTGPLTHSIADKARRQPLLLAASSTQEVEVTTILERDTEARVRSMLEGRCLHCLQVLQAP